MAEDSDLSRTEPASARRLQEAREAGDVPRSREFAGWLIVLAALGALAWQAPVLATALQGVIVAALRHAATPFAQPFVEAVVAVIWALLPLIAAVFVATLVAPILLSGWVYAPRRAQADPSRLAILKPFTQFFSADGWFDGGLALLKWGAVATAASWALASGWADLGTLDSDPGEVASWLGRALLVVVGALALAAALDAGWRWWRYLRRHAMTWQEVLAEAREAELPPEVQAQLRARQQQVGQGAAAGSSGAASPSPQPTPARGEGASAGPKSINEVIG